MSKFNCECLFDLKCDFWLNSFHSYDVKCFDLPLLIRHVAARRNKVITR